MIKMKKKEAKIIAIEKSKLVIEYIIQILSEPERVKAVMNFSFSKIENKQMCILNIYVPEKNFEKHLNLGIISEHCLVLYEQLLNDFLDTFLEHEMMGVSEYYSIKSMQGIFSGVSAVNSFGSEIKINFRITSPDFMKIVSEYERRYHEFVETLHNKSKVK